ncbi:MAG: hypothetical protein L6V93_22335 [Clostridiales bacterium]|nr:MAG: hypothetical protein L6V93_22335 [Clostridiales bacterium]
MTSFNVCSAKNAVDSIIGTDAQFVILATVTNISDNTFELTKRVCNPSERKREHSRHNHRYKV